MGRSKLYWRRRMKNEADQIQYLADAPEFYHVTLKNLKKNQYKKCGVCSRLLMNGDRALKHKDRRNSFYCPKDVKHLKTSEEYIEYLVKVQQVELGIEYTDALLASMAIDWYKKMTRSKVEVSTVKKGDRNYDEMQRYHEQKKKKAVMKELDELEKEYRKNRSSLIEKMSNL